MYRSPFHCYLANCQWLCYLTSFHCNFMELFCLQHRAVTCSKDLMKYSLVVSKWFLRSHFAQQPAPSLVQTEDFLLILSTFQSPSCGQAVSADCDSYVVIWGDIGARIWERKDHLLTLIILFVFPDPSLNGGDTFVFVIKSLVTKIVLNYLAATLPSQSGPDTGRRLMSW